MARKKSGGLGAGSSKSLTMDVKLEYLESLFHRAAGESELGIALEIYREVLDHCEAAAASAEFRSGRVSSSVEGWKRLHEAAVLGEASVLWKLNRMQESVASLNRLMVLDPSDRQRARFWLAACLYELRNYEELGALLDRFEDSSSAWKYVRALYAYARQGDTEPARQFLKDASRQGERFLDYLLGEGQVDSSRPIRFDSENSHHSFARLFLPVWRSVPGALAWTRKTLRVPLINKRNQQPLTLPLKQLLALPLTNSTWQIGVVPMDKEHAKGDPCWIVAVVDRKNKEMRTVNVVESQPTPTTLWPELLNAMLQPTDGKPARPTRIEVSRPEQRRAWQTSLRQIDCDCQIAYRMDELQSMLKGMNVLLAAKRMRSIEDDFDALALPQTDAIWQIDSFHNPIPISNPTVGVTRPWTVVLLDTSTSHVLGLERQMDKPTPEAFWSYVSRVMQRDKCRPRRVEFSDGDAFNFHRPMLANAKVDCELRDELPELYRHIFSLVSGLSDPHKCALADGRGVDRDDMESFYQTAAQFYERAPWKQVPGDIPIKVEFDKRPTRYAIVMGRSGMTLGISIYMSWNDLMGLFSGKTSIDQLTCISLTFDEEMIMAPQDLFLVERLGWPIATPEAYPAVMHLHPGGRSESPPKSELQYLEGLMHSLPEFIASGKQSETFKNRVAGCSGEIRLTWSTDRSRW